MREIRVKGDTILVPVPSVKDGVLLDEAQLQMLTDSIKGTHCPCCGRTMKIYPRSINSGAALGLLWLAQFSIRHPHEAWANVNDAPKSVRESREFTRLKHWGFIELCQKVPKGQRTSGKSAITFSGVRFARGEIDASKTCYIYRDRALGFSVQRTTIYEALGRKFDFQKLMASTIGREETDAEGS